MSSESKKEKGKLGFGGHKCPSTVEEATGRQTHEGKIVLIVIMDKNVHSL